MKDLNTLQLGRHALTADPIEEIGLTDRQWCERFGVLWSIEEVVERLAATVLAPPRPALRVA